MLYENIIWIQIIVLELHERGHVFYKIYLNTIFITSSQFLKMVSDHRKNKCVEKHNDMVGEREEWKGNWPY